MGTLKRIDKAYKISDGLNFKFKAVSLKNKHKLKKNLLISLVSIFFLLLLIVSPAVISGDTISIIKFDENRAFKDVLALTANGPRPATSANDWLGAQYVLEEFRKAGLKNTDIEEYPQTVFEVFNAKLSLVKYGILGLKVEEIIEFEHKYDFVIQSFSAPGSGEVDIVCVGDGTSLDKYSNAEGKATLLKTGGGIGGTGAYIQSSRSGAILNIIHNVKNAPPETDISTNTGLAYFTGAAAVDDNGFRMSFAEKYPEKLMPSVLVNHETGMLLQKAAEYNSEINPGYYRVRFDFDIVIERRSIPVVRGEAGNGRGPLVIIGAHIDTCYNTDGAVDNTVGTATIIEMARNIAKLNIQGTIRFLGFSGEEIGILGSTQYVLHHSEELTNNMAVYMNFDFHNIYLDRGPQGQFDISNKMYFPLVEELLEQLMQEVRYQKYDIRFFHGDRATSDTHAFKNMGLDAFYFRGSNQWEYHTVYDTVYDEQGNILINPESWSIGAKVFGGCAVAIANGWKP